MFDLNPENSKTMTRDHSPKVNIFIEKSYFQNESSVFKTGKCW